MSLIYAHSPERRDRGELLDNRLSLLLRGALHEPADEEARAIMFARTPYWPISTASPLIMAEARLGGSVMFHALDTMKNGQAAERDDRAARIAGLRAWRACAARPRAWL